MRSVAIERAAGEQTRWALRKGSRTRNAVAWGVDRSRLSHHAHDEPEDSALYDVCRAVMEGEEEHARAVLASVMRAWERRALLEAETPTLIARWHHLWYREHEVDAHEDMHAALYLNGGCGDEYDDALADHGALQLEMVEIRQELESRGVCTRAALKPEVVK